jgi:hypothetical protein
LIGVIETGKYDQSEILGHYITFQACATAGPFLPVIFENISQEIDKFLKVIL